MAFPTVQRLRETNTAGGCKLQLVPAGQVATVPPEIQGTVATDITLVDGASWVDLLPTHFTQQFREEWQLLGGDQVARAEVRAVIPKDRALLLHGLWGSKYHRFLVLHHDRNGTIKLMGRKEQPAMVRIVQLDHGADPRRDRNQYELQVVVTRRSPCPFYLATPPVMVPAECPSLSTLLAAESWASVAALLSPAQLEDARLQFLANVFGFGDSDDLTLEWEITADLAGTFTTFTQDGGSGTITYSLNGSPFAALPASLELTPGDTVQFQRTITDTQGWVKLEA